MFDTRHLIAYVLIVVLVASLIGVIARVRYLSPGAVEQRRRAKERRDRQSR